MIAINEIPVRRTRDNLYSLYNNSGEEKGRGEMKKPYGNSRTGIGEYSEYIQNIHQLFQSRFFCTLDSRALFLFTEGAAIGASLESRDGITIPSLDSS